MKIIQKRGTMKRATLALLSTVVFCGSGMESKASSRGMLKPIEAAYSGNLSESNTVPNAAAGLLYDYYTPLGLSLGAYVVSQVVDYVDWGEGCASLCNTLEKVTGKVTGWLRGVSSVSAAEQDDGGGIASVPKRCNRGSGDEEFSPDVTM